MNTVKQKSQVYEVHTRLAPDEGSAQDQVVLDHLQREKGRLKAVTEAGAELRIFLDRGKTLEVGELLRSRCGQLIEVLAAVEPVLHASAGDWQSFSRACYHLGNRHVKIQMGDCWLRITPDHVLAQMLQQLGLEVREERATFVPESGAYAGGQHDHHHH